MLCGLGLVSVSVDFLALYLVSKVSEKSGIGPPLYKMLQEYQGVLFYGTRFIEAHLEATSTAQYLVLQCN